MTKREKQLLEQGWEKRTEADEPRLSELVETYALLGFEVQLEPLPTKEEIEEESECGDCRVCFDNELLRERYKVIYTRKKNSVTGPDDESELL